MSEWNIPIHFEISLLLASNHVSDSNAFQLL